MQLKIPEIYFVVWVNPLPSIVLNYMHKTPIIKFHLAPQQNPTL